MELLKVMQKEAWGAQSAKRPSPAQVMIPGCWVRSHNQAPCSAGSPLLPPPLPLHLIMLSLSCSLSVRKRAQVDGTGGRRKGRSSPRTLGSSPAPKVDPYLSYPGAPSFLWLLFCVYLQAIFPA